MNLIKRVILKKLENKYKESVLDNASDLYNKLLGNYELQKACKTQI